MEIEFTKHAIEKFVLLERFGFTISKDKVIDAIRGPDNVDRRRGQSFSIKVINAEYALRVVHEQRYSSYNLLPREEGEIWAIN